MRTLVKIAMAVAVASVPAPANAGGEGVVGGILGIGALIVLNEAVKNDQRNKARQPRRAADPEFAQRRERLRDIQTRLNAIGYDAGLPDGVSGPRTRRAISGFQTSIGEPATGDLSDAQLATLYEQSGGIGIAGGAFPVLAAPTSVDGKVAAFPSLGTPLSPSNANQGAFPALGAQPEAGTASAFPTIGTPAEKPSESMPLVAGAEAAVFTVPENPTFDGELAKTGYAAASEPPKVLGIGLGDPLADLEAVLVENAFSDCGMVGSALQCSRQTETLSGVVKGWSSGDGIWAIARLIRFKEPVAADYIHQQFTAGYPELMATPTGLISSDSACTIRGDAVPQLAQLFDGRAQQDASAEVEQPLLDLAAHCPVAFSLAFNEGNGVVGAVQTLFFDGTSLIRQQESASSEKQAQLGSDLKF